MAEPVIYHLVFLVGHLVVHCWAAEEEEEEAVEELEE
jgi:TATA-box binding protein (TBP) (component of TFIID and TFIIIB)